MIKDQAFGVAGVTEVVEEVGNERGMAGEDTKTKPYRKEGLEDVGVSES